ncbi:hypothetical protein [Mucilaginibacter sp. HD30]
MKEMHHPFAVKSGAILDPQPPKPRRYREQPRWLVTKSRTDQKYQKMQNESVEAVYHRIITLAKQLILLHGGDTIYEQDHKSNPDSYTGMHSFVTSTFYWRLDCELNYNYEVYYAFHNCPYEQQVRELMHPFPLYCTTHEFKPKQGYEAFYTTVLEVQNAIHITTLKVTG